MARVWTAMVIASIGWGTTGVATRAALDEGVDVYALAFYRSIFAVAAVVAFLVIRRRGFPAGAAAWKVGLMMGITNLALPIVLANVALQYSSAGFLGLFAALIPMATAAMAHLLLPGEPLTTGKTLGLLLGLGGVAVLFLSGDSGLAEGGRPVLAGVLALVAVLSIAFGGVYSKKYAGRYDTLDVTGVHFSSGLVLIAVAMLVVEGTPGGESAAAWSLFVYMALFSTFMPFVLYYWMLQRVSASYAAMVGYVVPLIAVASGLLLLDEEIQPGIVIGGVLILIGVVVTDRAEARRSSSAAAPA